jgi:hypothetical protein
MNTIIECQSTKKENDQTRLVGQLGLVGWMGSTVSVVYRCAWPPAPTLIWQSIHRRFSTENVIVMARPGMSMQDLELSPPFGHTKEKTGRIASSV